MEGGQITLSFSIVAGFTTFLAIILGAVWSHSLWLSKQFASLRELIYRKVEHLESTFLRKLEYHEKYDDNRFQELGREMWEMKLDQVKVKNNASKKEN